MLGSEGLPKLKVDAGLLKLNGADAGAGAGAASFSAWLLSVAFEGAAGNFASELAKKLGIGPDFFS